MTFACGPASRARISAALAIISSAVIVTNANRQRGRLALAHPL
jgi:hypothetical protein